jgi:pimeloyl-ACP methyl ester carboxylesterase
MVDLLDTLGVERARVVGHDWGAALAWGLGMFAPERLERLVALSLGHPGSFAAVGLEQLQRSWYVFLYQLEGIAEEVVRANDWRFFRLFWQNEDIERSIQQMTRPGTLTAGLNWYRANVPPLSLLAPPLDLPKVPGPAMGIYSTLDPFLTEEQMRGSGRFVEGTFRYERIEGVGHWIPTEAPDRLNELLRDFLAT